jgi:hypothetical protein
VHGGGLSSWENTIESWLGAKLVYRQYLLLCSQEELEAWQSAPGSTTGLQTQSLKLGRK